MLGAPTLPTMKELRVVLVSTKPELVPLCPTGVYNPHRPLHCPSDASAQSTPASWHGTEPVQGFPCTSCLILWCEEEEGRKNMKKCNVSPHDPAQGQRRR